MREQIFQYGSARELCGILSLPDEPLPDATTVLIPNTGVDHRVGPNRMHVELARGLSAAGHAVLRLDLAGLGDSDLAAGRGSVDSTYDLAAAMDALIARGLGPRFTGIGLCSGAHDIHQIARIDERVVNAVFLDGYAYLTRRFWLNYGMDRLTNPQRYSNVLSKIRARLVDREEGELHDTVVEEIKFFDTPEPTQMKADLQTFIARNVGLCYIYTGQVQHEYNYREQLTDAFPLLRGYPKLALRYMLDCDHTFSRRAMRQELIRMLVDWVTNGSRPPREPRR